MANENMNNIGLIVNPRAGQGSHMNLEIARKVITKLKAYTVHTGPGVFGGDAFSQASLIDIPESLEGREITQWIAAKLVQLNLDALVVIGGDGTMADIAFSFAKLELSCPIFGIGAGSMNSGALITLHKDEIDLLENAEFNIIAVDALVTGYNNQDMAVAFNDVVISNTIVGTVDGKLCDLDASLFLSGDQVKRPPIPVASSTSVVTKSSGDREIIVANGFDVGGVVVGFSDPDNFLGKAVVGGACLTALAGIPAGCMVSEHPLARASIGKISNWKPLKSNYISLAKGESINVTGMQNPAVLCADGNPIKQLELEDNISIRVLSRAIDVVQLKKNHG